MVDVADRERYLHPVDAELLELHPGHRPGGVLEQHLVDVEHDVRARLEPAVAQPTLEDLAREGARGGHGRRMV